MNGDHVCGKVFRPPLSAPQLSRALRREQQRATYPNAKHRRKHLREFARQRKKYTQSSIHIALSRPEPIEKSVQGRCRAVCPAQGVQRGDEIHPCASHGCECLSSQKRLLRGGGEPPGAERREEADKPGAESHNKKNSSPKKTPKGRYVKISFLRILRCRGLSPAGRFLRGKQPLKLPHHTMLKQ